MIQSRATSTPANAGDLCDEDEILKSVSRGAHAPAGPAFAAGTLHYTLPICFGGDSRALPFRNAVYTSEFTSRSYSMRVAHLGITRATDFVSRDGGVGNGLLSALVMDRFAITREEGTTCTAAPWSAAIPGSLPIVLFCGPYELHEFMLELGPDTDVAAWDVRSSRYDARSKPALRLLPADEVRQRVHRSMEPFALGIEALRRMGFDRIFIHGMPPSAWGERFKRAYPHVPWFETSHPNAFPKVWLLYDEALREIAVRTSTHIVTGPLDAEGILPPEATWDDVHYTADGARAVVRTVLSIVEGVVE